MNTHGVSQTVFQLDDIRNGNFKELQQEKENSKFHKNQTGNITLIMTSQHFFFYLTHTHRLEIQNKKFLFS